MGRVQLLTCGIVSKVEQLQTNKTYMNKDFEVGSFLKQDDYTTYNQMGLILAAVRSVRCAVDWIAILSALTLLLCLKSCQSVWGGIGENIIYAKCNRVCRQKLETTKEEQARIANRTRGQRLVQYAKK